MFSTPMSKKSLMLNIVPSGADSILVKILSIIDFFFGVFSLILTKYTHLGARSRAK